MDPESITQDLIKKNINFLFSVNFSIFGHPNPGSGFESGFGSVFSLKYWIRCPTDGIRNAGGGEYAGERILGGGRECRVNALLLDAAQDSGEACRYQP
jgi:hypothetical protein